MRLNETKRKQRTSQEEVLAELFAEAELQGSVRKKKNWDAWLDQEEEQQSEKELQVYLEEYSDPTLYLTPKEVKAWNRMPKSKQKRLLEKESRQVLQAWKVGERKGSAGGGRKADSMEELVFLQGRGTQRGTRSGTPLHGIWKPEKGSTKGFGEERPTAPHNPQRHSSPGARQTHSKTGKQAAAGVQSAASSVAGSASTVTPATLAARTAKKTAQTFKNYVQEVNQAAQQAIGEERAKLEDTKQQNAQVGDLPSFVKYVGATIGSVVLAGAAMVLQLAAALLTALVTMLAFLLVAVLAISLIVSVIMSLIGGFLDQQPATGHGLPPFITEDMMEAFFAVQEESGIPVSTGVAQVIAESGFGLYGPGGDNGQGLSQLAYEYKNLFGIKYFSGDKYAIGGVDMSTGEETGNGNTTIIAGFSVYPDYGACIRQRGWMLNREPYAGKVAPYRNHNDKKYTKEAARGFMNGIRAAGWATDSSYVEKCVQHMDNYNLYRFDNMTYEEYQKSGGGNYDGTVTPLMQSIVDHAANNQGIYPCTPDMCAQWVTGIYQAAGAPTIPYGNAIDMWNNYKNTGNTSMENIPPGAIVCGSGYGTMGSIYGHVGIYLGNGMVANNRGYFSVESLEEWCSWQTATCQVGDLPSFVKYVGATIGSVVLAGAAMVLQLAAALLTALVTMLAFLLVAVLAISLIVSVIMSLIGGFLDQQPATGHGLPPFITEDMMEAFFAVQEESGIPVSTGVAQVIAESGFGLYGPGGDNGQGLSQLAYEYKNLFGIKYFSGDKYAIGGVDMSTGEETGNGNTTIIAGFSVYPDYGACIRQRGWMLNREPYAGKVAPYRNHNDKKYTKEAARGFMNGIRAAGWATDSSYVEKCVQHMDNYNLYRFDNMTYEEYQKSGGGNYDGTVTPLMQSIVDHAANNQGIYPCTPDMCAQWVTGIYQAAGAPTIPYGNAIDMWNNYKNTGNTSMENIPPGAIVCGSGYGTMGSIYGHVGIYLGNGMVANNRGYFSVESLEEWCSWQTATCQGHTGWIGWVFPGGVPAN